MLADALYSQMLSKLLAKVIDVAARRHSLACIRTRYGRGQAPHPTASTKAKIRLEGNLIYPQRPYGPGL